MLLLHLHFDVVQVFVAFLNLVPLQLVVLSCLLALLLRSRKLHVLLLKVPLSELLVLFERLNESVLLNFDLL